MKEYEELQKLLTDENVTVENIYTAAAGVGNGFDVYHYVTVTYYL
jgi:hypothetical protein